MKRKARTPAPAGATAERPPRKTRRTCGPCTACCEGHLEGQAYGHYFYLGRPCYFVGGAGCSIYRDRPKDPCRKFNCVWLTEDILPEWFRPDKSNVIVARCAWGPDRDLPYLKATERGSKIDSIALNLLYMYHVQTRTPLSVQIDRGWNHYGPLEFVQEMQKNAD